MSHNISIHTASSYRYNFETHTEEDDSSMSSSLESTVADDYLSKHRFIKLLNSLVNTARAFCEKMIELSEAAADFGIALEKMAKVKSANESGQGLQCSAGLQFLISNQHQVLQSQDNYQEALNIMSKEIKETEAKNILNGQKRSRDIHQFRKVLHDLTRQVNTVDYIQEEYYHHMKDIETKHHQMILNIVSLIIGAQLDIYENIPSKGTADPILENMIQQNSDPFCTYSTPTQESTDVFTVLSPISLFHGGLAVSSNTAEYSEDYSYKSDSTKEEESGSINITFTSPANSENNNSYSIANVCRLSLSSDAIDESGNDANNNLPSGTVHQQQEELICPPTLSTATKTSFPNVQKVIDAAVDPK